MEREELVERYLDGQLSRRVFIRRLVGTGVATATALTYAALLESAPPAGALGDYYLPINDYAFAVNPAVLSLGQPVTFANHSWPARHTHTAADLSGMRSWTTGPIPAWSQKVVTLPSAGTYPYGCPEGTAVHPSMRATITSLLDVVPASGNTATTFTIKWAPAALPSGFVVDVQRKAPGTTTWVAWKTGVTARSATFKTTVKGKWAFRARLRKPSNGKSSGWSRTAAITVT